MVNALADATRPEQIHPTLGLPRRAPRAEPQRSLTGAQLGDELSHLRIGGIEHLQLFGP